MTSFQLRKTIETNFVRLWNSWAYESLKITMNSHMRTFDETRHQNFWINFLSIFSNLMKFYVVAEASSSMWDDFFMTTVTWKDIWNDNVLVETLNWSLELNLRNLAKVKRALESDKIFKVFSWSQEDVRVWVQVEVLARLLSIVNRLMDFLSFRSDSTGR